MKKQDLKQIIKQTIRENYSPLDTWGQKALVSLNQLIAKNENSNFIDLLTQIKNEFSLENDELFKVAINSTYPIVDEDDLKSQIWDLQEEKVKPDYGTQLKMAADKAKREKNVEAMVYYQLLQNTSASVPFEKFKGSWAYDQWKDKPEVQKAIADIRAHFKSHPWLEENNDCNCGAQNKAEHDPHKDSCNVNKNTCKKCKKGEYRHQSYGKHGGFYACDYCGNELRESIDELNENTPPNFPKDLKAKLKSQYKDNPQKAYATMWAIHKKSGGKLEEMWNSVKENYDSDSHERASYDRQISSYNKKNKQRFQCPTCKTPNALSAWEHQKGYQCNKCADSEEGTF